MTDIREPNFTVDLPGEWVPAKSGMEYRQRKWVQRADGKWILTGGDWVTPTDKLAGKQ